MRPVSKRCPNRNCQVLLSIPRQLHWRRVRCSVCGRVFEVPPAAQTPGPKRRLRKAS